jgi:hypothetical protein
MKKQFKNITQGMKNRLNLVKTATSERMMSTLKTSKELPKSLVYRMKYWNKHSK